MAAWAKTLMVSICIITILMHLVPNGKFGKYVKFYGGLLFFLLAVQPLLSLLGREGELERLLQLEFLKEEYYDLETAMNGMEELKNDAVRTYYQQEILRQIKTIVQAYGMEALSVTATFSEDGYTMESVILETGEPESQRAAAVKAELTEVYSLQEAQIKLR